MSNHKRTAIKILFLIPFILCAIGIGFALRPERRASVRAAGETAINLADYYTFHWELYPHGEELGDGTVYRYQYLQDNEWHDYYTTSTLAQAPEEDWTAWRLLSSATVARSIVNVHSDGFVHELRVVSPDSDRFSVVYSKTCLVGEETGEFTARAELTLTDPAYRFVYETDDAEMGRRGMTVVIEGDTATVTKIWYAAHSENALLDGEESIRTHEEQAYAMDGWTFGNFSGAKPPRLRHGDELLFGGVQDEGYRASCGDSVYAQMTDGVPQLSADFFDGTNDTLTFTLLREGETVAADCPRDRWNYYFNDFTPAGAYTVRFIAKTLSVSAHSAWWEDGLRFSAGESGISYRGFTQVYDFEVRAGTFTMDDERLNDADRQEIRYLVPESLLRFGNYGAFFNRARDAVKFSGYLGRAQALTSGTFWGEPENAEAYFETMPVLSYNVAETKRGEYLPASADWSTVLNASGSFTVYYRAEMKNYLPVPESGEERYRHYFAAEIYDDAEETVEVTTEIRDANGNTVSVSVGNVRAGLSLAVSAGLKEEEQAALAKAGFLPLAAFAVSLKNGETTVSPAHEVRVSISVPATLNNIEELALVSVLPSGEIKLHACTGGQGTLTFTTDELATVCFISTAQNSSAPRETGGNDAALIVCVAIEGAAILGLAAGIAALLCKARKEKPPRK